MLKCALEKNTFCLIRNEQLKTNLLQEFIMKCIALKMVILEFQASNY